jgi:hypothetical protein
MESISTASGAGVAGEILVLHRVDRDGRFRRRSEFAQKSYDLFMDDWRPNQHDNEQHYAWGGTGGGAGLFAAKFDALRMWECSPFASLLSTYAIACRLTACPGCSFGSIMTATST